MMETSMVVLLVLGCVPGMLAGAGSTCSGDGCDDDTSRYQTPEVKHKMAATFIEALGHIGDVMADVGLDGDDITEHFSKVHFAMNLITEIFKSTKTEHGSKLLKRFIRVAEDQGIDEEGYIQYIFFGKPSDKLKLLFGVVDTDNNSYLSEAEIITFSEEFSKFIKPVLEMKGMPPSVTANMLGDVGAGAKFLFMMMDKNQNDKLSLKEFKEGAATLPTLMQSFM